MAHGDGERKKGTCLFLKSIIWNIQNEAPFVLKKLIYIAKPILFRPHLNTIIVLQGTSECGWPVFRRERAIFFLAVSLGKRQNFAEISR